MSDFETHLRWGIATHSVLVAIVVTTYLVGVSPLGALALAMATLPITLAGALFPDLDHPSSIPHRYGAHGCPVLAGALALAISLRYQPAVIETLGRVTGQPSAFLGGGLVASLAWATWLGTWRLFPILRPSHRTVTHRLSTGIVVALCIGASVSLLLGADGPIRTSVRAVSLAASATFLLGFLSHLSADGLHHDYATRLHALVTSHD
ncbi:hypothetical protein [Halarchaeum sp. P4]|uniref:hypothetical protein n=1 Tax=Halarchaeum sp. P4 TaxID=3421639 RepID=UPI003EBD7497